MESKRYRLLKDYNTPEFSFKSGTPLARIGEDYYALGNQRYNERQVKSMSDWFEQVEEIKPTDTKEVFMWNDKTVLEFLLKVLSNRMFGQVYTPETEIKNFKQSKESLKPDSSDFVAKGMKMGYDYYVDEKNKRLYTQQQYNEAIVNAFESAKQTITDPSNIHQLVYKFPTIESYLTSISNNK